MNIALSRQPSSYLAKMHPKKREMAFITSSALPSTFVAVRCRIAVRWNANPLCKLPTVDAYKRLLSSFRATTRTTASPLVCPVASRWPLLAGKNPILRNGDTLRTHRIRPCRDVNAIYLSHDALRRVVKYTLYFTLTVENLIKQRTSYVLCS